MKRVIFVLLSVVLTATMAFAQSAYRVQPGDTLQIEVLEDTTLNRTVLVTPDGRIAFPFAGSLRASGQTVDQIRTTLMAAIRSSFASEPTVFVSVAALHTREEREPATINVYFMGEVNTPGLREVAPGTTFLQALSQAGGFTSFAATKRVQLRRTNHRTGEQTLSTINYKALAQGAGLSQAIVLTEGDVILIPERGLFE
jgi:polysaccharide export outer membrane protein